MTMNHANDINLEKWVEDNRAQLCQGAYTPEDIERLALAVGFKQPEIDRWKSKQKTNEVA